MIWQTTCMESISGSMPGMISHPVRYSILPAAIPMRPMHSMTRPSFSMMEIIFSGILHMPYTISTDIKSTGRLFQSTSLTGICKSRPLTMLPTGIHPTPMRIPLENHGTSSFSIRPKPSGMVNVKVPPNIPAVTTPSIRPIFSFCASDIASG